MESLREAGEERAGVGIPNGWEPREIGNKSCNIAQQKKHIEVGNTRKGGADWDNITRYGKWEIPTPCHPPPLPPPCLHF